MSVFSTNQNRQLFVVNNVVTVDEEFKPSDLTNLGDTAMQELTPKDSQSQVLTEFYYLHKGYGDIMRSDLITVRNVRCWHATPNSALDMPLKAVKVELDSAINGGNPIPGQEYVIKINVNEFLSMSDESKLTIVASYTAKQNDTAKDLYIGLAANLFRTVKRNKLVNIYLDQTLIERVDSKNVPYASGNPITTASSILIEEADPSADWELGVAQIKRTRFEVSGGDIISNGMKAAAFTIAEDTPVGNPISGTYALADLEYFCMGERADQYRNVSWPKVIPTKYMVDVTSKYDVLDIEYFYKGIAEDCQESPKTLTLLVKSEVGLFKSEPSEPTKLVIDEDVLEGILPKTVTMIR